MDELKEIKLKNYQYLNEVAIKGETLFTGSSLMELFPICEIARSRGSLLQVSSDIRQP